MSPCSLGNKMLLSDSRTVYLGLISGIDKVHDDMPRSISRGEEERFRVPNLPDTANDPLTHDVDPLINYRLACWRIDTNNNTAGLHDSKLG